MKATLTFPNRELANKFTRYWACETLTGHSMSATHKTTGEVEVTVYDVTDDKKQLIENFINSH